MKFTFASTGKAPAEDIGRCLENILNIPEGSIPLSRGMGLRWTGLSKIPAEMENDIATDIVEKVEQYEPRVSVKEVEFSYPDDGEVLINIHIEKSDKFNEYE